MRLLNLLMPAAVALILCEVLAPALQADIFLSHGGGDAYSGIVTSFSQITGAPKLNFTGGLTWGVGVAYGPDNKLYVADQNTGSVLRYDPATGVSLGTFTPPYYPPGPFAITFGPDGNLYMADNFGYIRKFNGSTGAPLGVFSCAPSAGGNCYPFGLTFGPDGNLYVADQASRSVLKYNGTTLAYIGTFIAPIGGTYPQDLHFGPNGNLYVDYSVPTPQKNYYNDIFEFNGATGAEISYSVPGIAAAAFAFGPDGNIYVAGFSGFVRISPTTGVFLGTFGAADAEADVGFIAFGSGYNPDNVPPYVLFQPVTVTPTQTIRLTVVAGPVLVGPGVPVEAQLSFLNAAGAVVGPTKTASLNSGQTATLDFDVSTVISTGVLDLQPSVTLLPGTPLGGGLQGSVELFTTSNGYGSIFYAGVPVSPGSNELTGPPSFVPQGVAYGQSILIQALAPPDSPCAAVLSFTDANGNPVGPTKNVNLGPGTIGALSFNPNSLTQSGRQEFVPQITPTNATSPAGPGVASACLGSAEVIGQRTGVIWTYQTSSPGIGTAP